MHSYNPSSDHTSTDEDEDNEDDDESLKPPLIRIAEFRKVS